MIDLYQVDWAMRERGRPDASGWGAIAKLQQQGHIRAIGVVGYGIEDLRAAHAIVPIAALQTRLDLPYDEAGHELLEFCGEHGIGVLGQLPELDSLPAKPGRYEADTRLRMAATLGVCTPGEWRLDSRAHEPKLERALAIVDEMR